MTSDLLTSLFQFPYPVLKFVHTSETYKRTDQPPPYCSYSFPICNEAGWFVESTENQICVLDPTIPLISCEPPHLHTNSSDLTIETP